MTELKEMTNQELAFRIVGYVERLERLMDKISNMIHSKSLVEPYQIETVRDEYKRLKEEIKTDAHYVDLVRNKKRGNNLYNAIFAPSLQEASAWGFTSPTNSKINHEFYSSVEEAHYKLTKYYSFEKWKAITEDNANK
jgi:hypothetical protein